MHALARELRPEKGRYINPMDGGENGPDIARFSMACHFRYTRGS